MTASDPKSTISKFTPLWVDVDGAIDDQPEFVARYQPDVLDIRHRHGELRHWCPWPTVHEIADLIDAKVKAMPGPAVTFYGNSDNHHFAYMVISRHQEPLTSIGIDGHSDLFRATGKQLWAGNWMAGLFKLGIVKKHIQLGAEKDLALTKDFPAPLGKYLQRFDLIKAGLVEIWPTSLEESTLFGRMTIDSECVSIRPKNLFLSQCKWKSIRASGGMETAVNRILDRIPTEAVHLTLDKDGLCDEDQFSNQFGGRQGSMTRGELVILIKTVKQRKKLIGVDVCGDFTVPVSPPGSFKEKWSKYEMDSMPADARDHPAKYLKRNEETNIAIMEALNG
ncbi:MAG: hypothetical protein ACRCY3_12195 [Sphingorhabdus sp.]